tara:strand:+ start:369 stop:1253 length:885 start_codon:yes stop_codon:yes gene_type:complete
MKNLAVIGIGKWGKNLIRELDKFANVKICSSNGNKKNINWIKTHYPKIRHVKNTEQIFLDKEIDAIIISTPINTHYNLVKKSLLSKKHVFVEKPIACTMIQTNELIKIAKQNKCILFVGHIFLHNEIFKKLIQIKKNENIQNITFQWNKFGTFDEDIFLNLLSHDLSILLSLFKTPTKIQLHDNVSFLSKSDLINLSFHFRKIHATVMINRFSNYKKKIIIIKTNRNSYIWDDNQLFKQNKKSNEPKLLYKSKLSPLENECKNFIKSLSTPEITYESANLGKDVIQVIKKIKRK